jgi:hypothetical protein
MKAWSATLFLIMGLTVLATSCPGADWKYFGATMLDRGEAIGFYDAEGVEQLSTGNVKVWTKAFTDKAEFARAANRKTNIDSAAKKLSEYYVPPLCLVDSKDCEKFETVVNMVSWEVTANDAYLQPRVRILFEIDCGNRMIRTLSTILYKKRGISGSESTPGAWEHISPETNSDTLRKILCPMQ